MASGGHPHILMSIDAANRAWMQGATYREPMLAGRRHAHLRHRRSGRGIERPRLAPGDIVAAEARWAEYCADRRAPSADQDADRCVPLSHLLSVYGIAGKTAYHGLMGVGQPEGGGDGSCQRRRRVGRHLVGPDRQGLGLPRCRHRGRGGKMRLGVDELGFRRLRRLSRSGLSSRLLKEPHAPNGIDIYFDNVGGQGFGDDALSDERQGPHRPVVARSVSMTAPMRPRARATCPA